MKTLSEKLDVFFSTCSTEAYQCCFLRFVSSLEHESIQATPGCSIMHGEESGTIISCALKRPSDVITQTMLSDVLPMSSRRRRSQTSFQCCHAVDALRRPSALVMQMMRSDVLPMSSCRRCSAYQLAPGALSLRFSALTQLIKRQHCSNGRLQKEATFPPFTARSLILDLAGGCRPSASVVGHYMTKA